MHPSKLLFLVGWFATCLVRVHADNFASHVYERIYLWIMYELFCEINGAKEQKMILPQDPKHKWPGSRNIGTEYSDGKLSFSEFQWRLQGGSIPNVNMPSLPVLTAGNVEAMASRLLSLGFGTTLNIVDIDPSLAGFKPDPKDKYRSDYTELVTRVSRQHAKYRLDPSYDAILAEHSPILSKVTNAIVQLRRQDTKNYLGRLLNKPIEKGGFNIPADKIVQTKRPTQIRGGSEWVDVDLIQTYRNNVADLQKIGFVDEDKFFKYMSKIGDPGYSDKFQPSEFEHWRVLKEWKTVFLLNGMSNSAIRGCTNIT